MQTPGIELEGAYKSTSAVGGDSYWYSKGGAYWPSLEAALEEIPTSKRAGLTIALKINNIIEEYWWPDETKLSASDLVLKLVQEIDSSKFYTTEQTDQKFYNKTQSDERYSSADSIKEAYVNKLEYNLDREEDKQTQALVKQEIDGKSTKEELAIQVGAILNELNNKFSSILRNWVDPIEFVYDGNNNTFETSFEAVEPDISFITYDNNTKTLNPLYDYYHSEKTITFRKGVLIPGKKYFLLLKYLK